MAQNKSQLFSSREVQLAAMAKALAHPARLRILQVIAEKNACIVGSLVNELPLAQATVSQHLRELKNAGLIKGEIDGPRVCYCLNEEALKTARDYFDALFAGLKCC